MSTDTPEAFSRLSGRSARDGYVNPIGAKWDSDWCVRRTVNGSVHDLSFKRRYCKQCHSIDETASEIRRGVDGLLTCGCCGRIFSGLDNDWPILSKYIRCKK